MIPGKYYYIGEIKMSKELTYYVSDDVINCMCKGSTPSSRFSLTKSDFYNNEIKIISPKNKVKKYIVLYEQGGLFGTTSNWSIKYFSSIDEFERVSVKGLHKPIQLILESEKIFEE